MFNWGEIRKSYLKYREGSQSKRLEGPCPQDLILCTKRSIEKGFEASDMLRLVKTYQCGQSLIFVLPAGVGGLRNRKESRQLCLLNFLLLYFRFPFFFVLWSKIGCDSWSQLSSSLMLCVVASTTIKVYTLLYFSCYCLAIRKDR